MPNRGSIAAIVLAAGKGTRMKSATPKVLHRLAGRPVLDWVVGAVQAAGIDDITVVLSPDLEPFQSFMAEHGEFRIAVQKGQKGTGDAAASAAEAFMGVQKPAYADGFLHRGAPLAAEWVVIVTGDTPAISAKTLREFVASTLQSGKDLAVLGMNISEPFGYGRLVLGLSGGLEKIVEERDADLHTKKIQLCNSGIVMAKTPRLFELLRLLIPQNSQKEYYLTDVFALAAAAGKPAHVFETHSAREFLGVNDRVQLESLEEWLLDQRLTILMQSGVTLHRPKTVYLEATAAVEPDAEIFPGVSILGRSRVASGAQIGPGTVLQDVDVGEGASVGAQCVLTNMRVKAGSRVPAGTVQAEMEI